MACARRAGRAGENASLEASCFGFKGLFTLILRIFITIYSIKTGLTAFVKMGLGYS